jgi:ubiquinone biosynthesis protein
MLDGLFAITRDFDMQTQPHLLLLQKTMVMVEGVATMLDPDINMWDVSGPYVKAWLRDELGPEARAADAILGGGDLLRRLPSLLRRIDEAFPEKGGAPPHAPLPVVELVWHSSRPGIRALSYVSVAVFAALCGAGAMWWLG